MINSTQSEKRFWRKLSMLCIGLAILYAIMLFGVNKLLGHKVIDPIIAFILFLIVALILPFFGSKFLRMRRTSFPDLDQMKEDFEKTANDEIINKLGEETYLELYQEELNQLIVDGIRICQELLSKDKLREDDGLRFHIYVKLAKFYIKDDQYDKAVANFKEALSIKPADLIVNLMIANVYEWLGAGTDAIASYETALHRSSELSQRFLTYITSQIERVKTKGPRKKPALSGLRYMSH